MTLLDREELRIRWRRALLQTPEGLAWLVANARARERDVGPHRQDAPTEDGVYINRGVFFALVDP